MREDLNIINQIKPFQEEACEEFDNAVYEWI